VHNSPQSALFNFQSLLLVILLLICTCTYIRAVSPRLIDGNKQGCVPPLLLFVCTPSVHHPSPSLPPYLCSPMLMVCSVVFLACFSCLHELVNPVSLYHLTWLSERVLRCRRTVIALCGVSVRCNGHANDTLVRRVRVVNVSRRVTITRGNARAQGGGRRDE
jgi:hypothetical protein